MSDQAQRQPEKWQVQRAFDRAAKTYDQAATLQQRVCHQLLTQLPIENMPQRILDAGCGTGYGWQLLTQRYPQAEIHSLDFARAMLTTHPAEQLKTQGDLEQLPIAKHCMDLYWSSLAVQWCDLAQVVHEARRVLRTDGHLALATLAEGTFIELKTAFSGLDAYQHTLDFVSEADLVSALKQAGFHQIHVEKRRKQTVYPSLRHLLRAVKDVGANQLGAGRRKGLLTRHALQTLTERYEAFRSTEGLPLSYEVIYCHAR